MQRINKKDVNNNNNNSIKIDDDVIIFAIDITGIKVTNRGQWISDK
ncbi:MAG: hypothetical protein M3Z01_02695 [Thermoproteota archaeon]|nr:hypothetical protein [Thermoproteota archaeon]